MRTKLNGWPQNYKSSDLDVLFAKKKPHGGARKGAGRKPGITFKEPTVVMRIPISKVEAVKKLLKKEKSKILKG